MHDGCSGSFQNGAQSVDKLRTMGFSQGMLPLPHLIDCECGNQITMNTFEYKCPHCGMVYGVTPCSAHDPSKVGKAGINY
jgi:hypothetical protein